MEWQTKTSEQIFVSKGKSSDQFHVLVILIIHILHLLCISLRWSQYKGQGKITTHPCTWSHTRNLPVTWISRASTSLIFKDSSNCSRCSFSCSSHGIILEAQIPFSSDIIWPSMKGIGMSQLYPLSWTSGSNFGRHLQSPGFDSLCNHWCTVAWTSPWDLYWLLLSTEVH